MLWCDQRDLLISCVDARYRATVSSFCALRVSFLVTPRVCGRASAQRYSLHCTQLFLLTGAAEGKKRGTLVEVSSLPFCHVRGQQDDLRILFFRPARRVRHPGRLGLQRSRARVRADRVGHLELGASPEQTLADAQLQGRPLGGGRVAAEIPGLRPHPGGWEATQVAAGKLIGGLGQSGASIWLFS